MPSTDGMEMFVRKEPLSDEEWFDLLEIRRKLISSYFNSITLPDLGSLECLECESFKHDLSIDNPTLSRDSRFSLKTQGIFCVQPWNVVERSGVPDASGTSCPRDGVLRVWGLTRANLWVLVTIGFRGEWGYRDRGYERAKTVEIVESDPRAIVATTKEKPQRMWEELGRAIKDWAERRKALYHEALRIARIVENEELAFSIVPKGA